LTRRAVALNGICKSITRITRTVNQPVTGVTGGCDLIGARCTRDCGRVGTVATRSTGTTRTVNQPVTGVTGGCDLIGARCTRDCGRVGTVATGAAIVATGNVIFHSRSILSTWASFTGVGFDEGIQFWGCHVRARVATTVPTVGAGRRGKELRPLLTAHCACEATIFKHIEHHPSSIT